MPSGVYQRRKGIMIGRKKGFKHSKETKDKIKEGNKRRYVKFPNLKRQIAEKLSGSKSHLWQGGKSFEPYSVDWTKSLKQSIRERDHFICQLCNNPQTDRVHSVHHIDYNKQNCNPDNLITLCVGCNTKVNKNRENWTNYFKGRK